MQRIEKRTEILNDLLHINKEYAAECEGLIKSLMHNDPVVCNLIREMAAVGQGCLYELRLQTDTALGDPADAVEIKGEIYKAWQNMSGIQFSPGSPEIFICCDKKVKGLRECYKNALQCGEDFSKDVKNLLRKQLHQINSMVMVIRKFNRELAY